MAAADLTRLNAFVEVAERGSFGRAADVLGRTTSTVSYAIRALEEDLQVRLLNRTTRSVTLTEAGEQLLARVRPLLDGLTDAVESMGEFRDVVSGRLRLSMSALARDLVLARLLPGFTAAYPDVTLEVEVDDEGGDLRGVDAGIRSMGRIPQDMIPVRITPPDRQVAVASPAYLARHGEPRALADLSDHRCVQFRFASGAPYRWEFQEDGRRVEVTIPPAVTTDSVDFVLRAAMDGIGLGYTIEAHARPHIEARRLKVVLADHALPFPGWFLYFPSRRIPTRPLLALQDYVRRLGDSSTPSNRPGEPRSIHAEAPGP